MASCCGEGSKSTMDRNRAVKESWYFPEKKYLVYRFICFVHSLKSIFFRFLGHSCAAESERRTGKNGGEILF